MAPNAFVLALSLFVSLFSAISSSASSSFDDDSSGATSGGGGLCFSGPACNCQKVGGDLCLLTLIGILVVVLILLCICLPCLLTAACCAAICPCNSHNHTSTHTTERIIYRDGPAPNGFQQQGQRQQYYVPYEQGNATNQRGSASQSNNMYADSRGANNVDPSPLLSKV